jgi:hypothetical protein
VFNRKELATLSSKVEELETQLKDTNFKLSRLSIEVETTSRTLEKVTGREILSNRREKK